MNKKTSRIFALQKISMNFQQSNIQEYFDTTNLLKFIFKKKLQLFVIGITVAVLSAIVSFLIEPKFKSTVVLFPASSTSLSKTIFSNNMGNKQDLLKFGEEEDAEKMLQILYSDVILTRLNNKYNLFKHYEIDQNDKYKYTKLAQEFEDNVSYKRTEYQSIQIDVLDKHPDTAAMLANDIAAYIDSVKNSIQKQRAIEAVKVLESEFSKLESRIKGMEDSLQYYRKLGVLEFEVQVEKYSEQLAIAINAGKKDAEKLLQSKLDTLAKYGAVQVAMREQILLERERLVKLLQSLEEARVDAERDFPQKFVVNYAFPAEKKSYPVRSLIVIASTLSALLLGLIFLIWQENRTAR